MNHVSYCSSPDNHVCELYYENGRWLGNDLTAATNTPPPYTGAMTSFFDGSIEHVFYISAFDYHVRELYFDGRWLSTDLTQVTNGPVAWNFAALTGFFANGIEHVFYLSDDGHVRELYYDNGRWLGNDLIAAAALWPPLPYINEDYRSSYSWLTSFFANGVEHVFYINRSRTCVRAVL